MEKTIIIIIIMIIIIIIIIIIIKKEENNCIIVDLILIKKEENNCIIVDFAIPYDTRIEQKEKEKVEKYQDLKRELQKLWNMKVKVVPIVIGALGTPPKDIKRRVQELGIETRIEEMQKTVILQSARILRKVLEN